MTENGFGECESCDGFVERIGWDRYCFNCQDEMRQEDEERAAQLHDEDKFLYTVPYALPGA